jgi:hypothetical protein
MNLGTIDTRFSYFVNDSNHVRFNTTTERYFYINEAYKYYYARLVSCGYKSLLTTPTLLDITADSELVALPSDFLRATLVERVIDDIWYGMCPFEKDSDYVEYTDWVDSDDIPQYSFQGNNLVLIDVPTESVTEGIRLTYWPVATEMSETTDTPDTGFNSMWHGLIPVLAAIYAKGGREEQNSGPLGQMLGKMEQPFNDMIDRMSVGRQTATPFYT